MMEILDDARWFLLVQVGLLIAVFAVAVLGSNRRPEPTVNGKKYFYGKGFRNLRWLALILAASFIWAATGEHELDRWATAFLLMQSGIMIAGAIYLFAECETIYIVDTDGIVRQGWRDALRLSWRDVTGVEYRPAPKTPVINVKSVVIRASESALVVNGFVSGFDDILQTIAQSAPHAEGVNKIREALAAGAT